MRIINDHKIKKHKPLKTISNINVSWSWEYQLSGFCGCIPWAALFVYFEWVLIAIQLAGIYGMVYFSTRDLERIKKESDKFFNQ